MIQITNNTTIYILCPANYATGGPEALHQLGAELISSGHNVFMYYIDYDKTNFTKPIHDSYKHYHIPYTLNVTNSRNNILIYPETYCTLLWDRKYSEMQKFVWWLSVTNFTIVLNNIKKKYEKKSFYFIKKLYKNYPIPTLDKVKKSNVSHIAHSYFSIDFLKENNIPVIGQISDYMNTTFLTNQDCKNKKEDIIIYNPTKNDAFLDKIINLTQQYNWIPIKNMTPNQVSETMKKAKVYIDFGYHPGKERMPREACLMDCCLIIGKDGSAKYKEDMPILDVYHFEKEEKYISSIVDKIKDCIVHYDQNIKDFNDYKQILLNEKNTFKIAVNSLFKH